MLFSVLCKPTGEAGEEKFGTKKAACIGMYKFTGDAPYG